MNTRILRFAAIALSSSVVAASIVVPAHAAEGDGYLGLTSGGSLDGSDRVASDDLREIDTTFQLSNENEIVMANFGLDLTITGPAKAKSKDGKLSVQTRMTNIAIKANLPLNPSDEGSLVDFRTFGNNGKLTIGFNTYHSRYALSDDRQSGLGRFAKACIQVAGEKWLGERPGRSQSDVATVLTVFQAGLDGGKEISAALAAAAKSTGEDGFGTYASAACKVGPGSGIGNDEDYVKFGERALGKDGFAAWKRRNALPGGSFFYGAEASLGYNRFSIVDRSTVTVSVRDRVGFDFNGRAGYVFDGAGTVAFLTGGYTRVYKAKDEVEVCGPPGPSGSTVCVSGQDGLPELQDTWYASATVRHVFRDKNGRPIVGIRPSVTYIGEDKDWQFELPIYFQRNDDGGLDAGIKAVYNTGARKASFGAFVGVPF